MTTQPYERVPRILAREAPVDTRPGFCKCGCGERTALASRPDARRGRAAGEPLDFLCGHGNRAVSALWSVTGTGYETPCWLWTGTLNIAGYAYRNHRAGSRLVHRRHYEEAYGTVPPGLDLDHLCRVRRCVNPDHLEPVTRSENARRGAKTKLTVAAVREIRRSSESDLVLAARYGVAPGTIWNARSGNQWKDVA